MVTHRPAWPSWVRYGPYQFAKSRRRPLGRRSDFQAIVMTESSMFSDSNLHPNLDTAYCIVYLDTAHNTVHLHSAHCTVGANLREEE